MQVLTTSTSTKRQNLLFSWTWATETTQQCAWSSSCLHLSQPTHISVNSGLADSDYAGHGLTTCQSQMRESDECLARTVHCSQHDTAKVLSQVPTHVQMWLLQIKYPYNMQCRSLYFEYTTCASSILRMQRQQSSSSLSSTIMSLTLLLLCALC